MIHLEDGSRKEELFSMWQRIFHDTRPYTEFYFDEVYGKNEVLLEENDEGLRGMLHLNPYTFLAGDSTVTAQYIVGVSTEEEYRRQGVMRSLLMDTFSRLRSRGEAFTYLMPADENYYLPFSFRFGMTQTEQEIEAGKLMPDEAGYVFSNPREIELQEFVSMENAWKKQNYALTTEVSEDYYIRLEKEVRSEFGCLFYARKEGVAAGRFVVYAEDDFLAISQLACFSKENRGEFIGQIIRFCDARYHYKKYRITYPEDWTKEDRISQGQLPALRIFSTKNNKVIMFRIVNLEAMTGLFGEQQDASCTLYVTDPDIREQEGCYTFTSSAEGLFIERTNLKAEQADGQISIADLTERLIGIQGDSMALPDSFHDNAAAFWTGLRALSPIEIPEIV